MFHAVSEIIRLQADPNDGVAIFDRGLFDASAWIRWHSLSNQLDSKTASILQSVCLVGAWQQQVDAVFLLEASFEVILERRQGRLGQIVNRETLDQLAESYTAVRADQKVGLTMPVFVIPTDHRSPEEVEDAMMSVLRDISAGKNV